MQISVQTTHRIQSEELLGRNAVWAGHDGRYSSVCKKGLLFLSRARKVWLTLGTMLLTVFKLNGSTKTAAPACVCGYLTLWFLRRCAGLRRWDVGICVVTRSQDRVLRHPGDNRASSGLPEAGRVGIFLTCTMQATGHTF
jgi:hypothetical protein